MHLAHHPIFIALSALTAWLGAWTALDLFRRMQAHTGFYRRAWVAAAGIAMGLSIWSMHFIAMLGFDPGTEVRYEVRLTVLSLLLAIAATTFAFVFARPTRLRQLASGLVMATGICGMHYMGMAAVVTRATLTNEPVFVVLAFLVAVVASAGALMVAMRETTLAQRLLAAVVLGFAIVGMHYTAMLGVHITADPSSIIQSRGIEPFVLAVAVAAGTLFILMLALIAALSDQRFEAIAVHEALRSEKQVRSILENLPMGIFVAASPSGEIQFANAEAARLLGHPLGGAALWAHEGTHGAIHETGRRLTPEEHLLHKAIRENRRAGPVIQRYRRGDGELIQLEVTAAPIPDRENCGSFSVAAFQDVTAKILAEEQARQAATLRESEERFRLIAEQAPVMLWMSDVSGHCVYVNKALREFSDSETINNTDAWIASADEEGQSDILRRIEHAQHAHEGFSLEATVRRADGERRLVHILACPRFGEDRHFLGLIGVNTDITQARQAERNLQHINDLLEQRVKAALVEKGEAEAALMHAQRLESLGRLTGGVAHDFNNLLTVIIGALDIILRDSDNAARRARLGEAALKAARRGEQLTAQLLAFARRQPLQPQTCDLNQLIRECEPLLRRATGEDLSLTLRLSEEKTIALIDPTQFAASLLNLVVNAVDASTPGGAIEIDTRIVPAPKEKERNAKHERVIRVSVSDRGQGMSQELVDHIFEPFFTTKAPGKGTGLGLSQVYGFVKQSGGEVQVESTLGRGTCMSVMLPLQASESQIAQQRAVATQSFTRALHVLLAEDDSSVAAITQAMLVDLGHEVTCAANAEQALQALQSDSDVDVLLTDVLMPGGMNGVELAQEAVKIRNGLSVLLCSGYAGEALDQSIARGEWPFLKKPFQRNELAEALGWLASQSTMQRSRRG